MSKIGIQFFTICPVDCREHHNSAALLPVLRKQGYGGALLHREVDTDVLEKETVLVAIFDDRSTCQLLGNSDGWRRLEEDDPSGPLWAWGYIRFVVGGEKTFDSIQVNQTALRIAAEAERIIRESPALWERRIGTNKTTSSTHMST